MPRADHRVHVWPRSRALGQRFIMRDWLAITIFHHIFTWRELDEAELAHELTHVAQWRVHGPLFIARYVLASRRASGMGGHRYRDNTFELEARSAEHAIRARMAGGDGDVMDPRPTLPVAPG